MLTNDALSTEFEITPGMIAALRRRGLIIVPIEPTAKMVDEAFDPVHGENAEGTWRAMIMAAPNPTGAEILGE